MLLFFTSTTAIRLWDKTMMLSVIVPICGRNREEQVKTFLRFLRKQTATDYEVILIEQVNANLGGVNLGGPFYDRAKVDRYLAIEASGKNYFNQPWMANVGAKLASGDRFLFLDIDIIFDENYLSRVKSYRKPFFFGYEKVHLLSKKISEFIRKEGYIPENFKDGCTTGTSGSLRYAGFSVAADKNYFFDALGGYNENYPGWGGNDNDIAWRSYKVLNAEFRLPKDIFHLWHPAHYKRFLTKERKSIWLTTYNHPEKVTSRIKNLNIGNPKTPTFIDLKDIFVPWKPKKRA